MNSESTLLIIAVLNSVSVLQQKKSNKNNCSLAIACTFLVYEFLKFIK